MDATQIAAEIAELLRLDALGQTEEDEGTAPYAKVWTKLEQLGSNTYSLVCHMTRGGGWHLDERFFDLFDTQDDPRIAFWKGQSVLEIAGTIDGKEFYISLHND